MMLVGDRLHVDDRTVGDRRRDLVAQTRDRIDQPAPVDARNTVDEDTEIDDSVAGLSGTGRELLTGDRTEVDQPAREGAIGRPLGEVHRAALEVEPHVLVGVDHEDAGELLVARGVEHLRADEPGRGVAVGGRGVDGLGRAHAATNSSVRSNGVRTLTVPRSIPSSTATRLSMTTSRADEGSISWQGIAASLASEPSWRA